MAIIPWRQRSRQSLTPVSSLQSEMNRVFEDFLTQPFSSMPMFQGQAPAVDTIVPALDVKEDDENIVVCAELPGINRDDLEISVNRDILEIRGQKCEEQKRDGENLYMVERSYGSFSRRIPLPSEVDSERAEASMQNGVLTLRLPKTEPSQQRKTIPIQEQSAQEQSAQEQSAQSQSAQAQSQSSS